MTKLFGFVLGASALLAATVPALASNVAPAPIIGASITGLVTLAAAAGGYLFFKARRRKDRE